MDIIRTSQKNWKGHIMSGNSLQREIMKGWKERKEEEGLEKSPWTGRWRTDTGNPRKRYNIEKSGVVGHLDLPGGRSPKEVYNPFVPLFCTHCAIGL